MSTLALWPNESPTQWVPRFLTGSGRHVDHFPQNHEQVKNEKSHTSTPTSLHGVGTDNYHVLGAFAKLQKSAISFVMSVRPQGTTHNSVPTGGSFMKFNI